MAFVEYNVGNNIEGVPVKIPFGDGSTQLVVEDGNGVTFKDKDGVALTNFPIDVEYYNENNVVTKREVILVGFVDGDILKTLTRQYESCVQDDSQSPKLISNNKLDFGASNVFVSVRNTARQIDNVKDEVVRLETEKANESEVVHNTGDEAIGGIKTFTSSPLLPTPSLGDNSTKGATTEYVDASILGGSSVDLLVNQDFYMGENGVTGKTVLIENNITSADATLTQNIGDVVGNTRVAVRVFGSGVVDNFIDCKLPFVTGSPSTDLEFRLETDNAGQPSGALANINATDSLTTAGVLAGKKPTLGFEAFSFDGLDYTGSTTAAGTETLGFKILVNSDCIITDIKKHSDCTATRCRIFDSGYTLVDTATFSGDVATFSINASTSDIFFIEADNSGASYIRSLVGAGSYPVNGTNVNITGGSFAGASQTGYQNLESITTKIGDYDDLGLTAGTPYRLVMNQTGDTVNGSNYFTIGYSAQQTNTRILTTYDGSDYTVPYQFTDTFQGTIIDTAKRTVTQPVGGEALITQNDGLRLEVPRDAVGERGNVLGAVTTGDIAVTTSIAIQYNNSTGSGIYTRLYFSAGNYAEIELRDTGVGTNTLYYRVYEASTLTQSGSLFVGGGYQQIKIYFKASGDVEFYYWNGSWAQLGTTYSTTLSGNHNIQIGTIGQSQSSGLLWVGFCDYTYAIGNDFATMIPQISTGTNFVYLSSGLFLGQLLTYTNATLPYKTDLFGTLQSNASIGNKGQVGFEGIDSNQSGLTIGATQYLSDTAGELSETPGTYEYIVGEALTDTSLKFATKQPYSNLSTIAFSTATSGAVNYDINLGPRNKAYVTIVSPGSGNSNYRCSAYSGIIVKGKGFFGHGFENFVGNSAALVNNFHNGYSNKTSFQFQIVSAPATHILNITDLEQGIRFEQVSANGGRVIQGLAVIN